MAETRNSRIMSAVQLLAAVYLSSILMQGVRAGMRDPEPGPVTCRYVFLSGQSTVSQTGGFAGVHEVYPVKGSFVLTVDLNAGTASFDAVDAGVTHDTRFLPTADLNGLFNMTALAGAVVDKSTFEFRGKTEDEVCDVSFRLVPKDDIVHLTGETIAPPNSADMFIFRLEATARRKYASGTGEPNDPYLIYTAEQMNAIGAEPNDWDKHFKLMADIDLAELADTQFNIIGTNLRPSSREGFDGSVIVSGDVTPPFTGVFDGNGHAISNFVYTAGKLLNVGLFSVVADPNAVIRNLRLIAPRIDISLGGAVTGSLVGQLVEGTLFNCHAENVDVRGQCDNVGGLVGESGSFQNTATTIRTCSCTGRVSAKFWTVFGGAGGLVGTDWHGHFWECSAVCEVTGEDSVGGLVGRATESIFVNCYSLGSATGGDPVGGLVGYGAGAEIIDCYSASRISGPGYVNGLLGRHSGSRVTSSFWDAEISEWLKYAGVAGRTTAEMQDPNTFMYAGWDFVGKADGPSDIWAEPPGGGYPILWWQLAELPQLPFSDGTGSPDDPYLIATAEQLNSIGYNPRLMAAHFRVINDIDMSGVYFYPIGTAEYPYAYAGVFDGGNFTISNLTYVATEREDAGLFRIIAGRDAEVRNVRLVNPVVESTNTIKIGSLVGWLRLGILRNCHVEGGRVSGWTHVGGLVGRSGALYSLEGSIQAQIVNCGANATVAGQWGIGGLVGTNGESAKVAYCYADGAISAVGGDTGGLVGTNRLGVIVNSRAGGIVVGKQSGGLVGRNLRGTVQRSFSTASVQGDTEVGGLVGFNYGTIVDCYAIAAVNGRDKVGGLAGHNGYKYIDPDGEDVGADVGTISNCYSASSVSGTQNVGGLVGYNEIGAVATSFWDVAASGLPARPGGAGKTTAEMQMASTFLNAGWDFVGEVENGTEDIWWIDEGKDYPRLSWEQVE